MTKKHEDSLPSEGTLDYSEEVSDEQLLEKLNQNLRRLRNPRQIVVSSDGFPEETVTEAMLAEKVEEKQ